MRSLRSAQRWEFMSRGLEVSRRATSTFRPRASSSFASRSWSQLLRSRLCHMKEPQVVKFHEVLLHFRWKPGLRRLRKQGSQSRTGLPAAQQWHFANPVRPPDYSMSSARSTLQSAENAEHGPLSHHLIAGASALLLPGSHVVRGCFLVAVGSGALVVVGCFLVVVRFLQGLSWGSCSSLRCKAECLGLSYHCKHYIKLREFQARV